MSKYRIPVTIETVASHTIGMVDCDSGEEFKRLAKELWESQGWEAPDTNCSNDFDLNEWDIAPVEESDLIYYTSPDGE